MADVVAADRAAVGQAVADHRVDFLVVAAADAGINRFGICLPTSYFASAAVIMPSLSWS